MVGILDFEEANAVQKFGVSEDELTAPSGILASRIKVDEAFVETDSALEKSFIPVSYTHLTLPTNREV